ncbi:energy transducer TonB [Phaeobacter gallaeciensis]|uniref:Outer membrane transport energization protein TonB n=1 Tax=Phaeobacter gallaeciensis TaxID=60890 RepID=A0AAC9Z7B8_9RHOB|nr:energy transducer TonB [Phaeobacter gallaeciensis]AHD08616.1 outer membrane transport energization protein TonB [Phaeobacter gallaeciensis DSM 26640]ATE91882.1 outer membrane transport energization protein TonB [Phaeobacter gallaeciensis]ATE98294.1 outer membrane transport energization protein TonB [Phaeobacter gallaeciensis]ATF00498.1 outer membrane transport energization protein TonB [Phaeobacter gallaeciensis]ATF04929.1 outer membrane transport energization protein TonB [Phaeobacter gall
MKRAAELTVFAGIATVIHVALFASAPKSGAEASGGGGDAMVSVQAASATVAEMVETWERPPQTQPQIDTALTPPQTAPTAPVVPQFELAQAPSAARQIALSQPKPDDTLQLDTTPAPPPPPPKAEPQPDPDLRPRAKPRAKPQPEPKPQTARKAQQTSAGRAAQRAAGSGGGAQAGQAGRAAAATAQAGQQAKLKSIWGAKIRARVERNKRRTSGTRATGRVLLRLTVARNGQLISYRIAKSSGNAALDQAALKAVARARRFPAAPKQLTLNQMTFNLPITFSK